MNVGHVTQLLRHAGTGDEAASAELVQLVYADMHKLAARYLSTEVSEHILQPTALVNETYLRLFGADEPLKVNDRAHFFAIAATQMRRILVDNARSRRTQKRNGIQIELDEALPGPGKDTDLVAVDDALKELARDYPENAQVVELRFFGGYTNEETAEILGKSLAKVRRDWEFARAWLYNRLSAN